jgi:hypothetical protein
LQQRTPLAEAGIGGDRRLNLGIEGGDAVAEEAEMSGEVGGANPVVARYKDDKSGSPHGG